LRGLRDDSSDATQVSAGHSIAARSRALLRSCASVSQGIGAPPGIARRIVLAAGGAAAARDGREEMPHLKTHDAVVAVDELGG